MDWNRPGKLIRPNPDWEDDLFQTVVLSSADEKRIQSYTAPFKKRKSPRNCICQDRSRPGVAPRITLNNGRSIPSLGIGTWLGLDKTGVPIPVSDSSIYNAVCAAIDAGYRLIDTAYIYKTEKQVGWAIKKKIQQGVVQREDLFIVTKLWNHDHSKRAVVPALKRSLADLGLDYVDLYLIHWPVGLLPDDSYDETDYLQTWQGMIEARMSGLTKAIGVSNFNQHQLDRILSLSKVKPAVLQIEMNLNIQQKSLVRFCNLHNIVVMAYSPFGSLFHATASPLAPPPRTDTQLLLQISMKYHKTVPQIALRYLVELGVIPIPKSVNQSRIQSNIEVFDFRLTKQEREALARYNRNYRTVPAIYWRQSPHYPFKELK